MNYYKDSSEWKWLFKNAIDWNSILSLYYPEFPTEDGFENKEDIIEFMEEVLTQTGKWCANSVANRATDLDKEGAGTIENDSMVPGASLQKFYQEAKDMDLFGLTASLDHGGLGLPFSLSYLVSEQIGRACMSSSSQYGFFLIIIYMIRRFCSEEICDKYIPRIVKGELSGAMCLTEPDSGSDVGSIRTTATKQADGTYILNGNKIFITNGGGGVNFILARIQGGPEGLKGISLFLAEEWIEKAGSKIHNYRIVKNEEKMGLHGSFTCEILYQNTIAILVGKEHEGFRLMLHLMNAARIGVGIQAIAGMEAAINYAKKYAEERQQFGMPIAKLPLLRKNIENYETEISAFRTLIVDSLSWFDIYQKLDFQKRYQKLSIEEQKLLKQAQKITRKRTPLVKYYGSETYVELSQRAIQILGGYGFMKDYPVERFHRDSFGLILYEGTSQIQSLMALKDFIKSILQNPLHFFTSLIKEHPIFFLGKPKTTRLLYKSQHIFKKKILVLLRDCFVPKLRLTNPIGAMLSLSKKHWQKQENFEKLMTHAETFCQAMSYLETLRVLNQHANKDHSRQCLFIDYYHLVFPRFCGIYATWKIR